MIDATSTCDGIRLLDSPEARHPPVERLVGDELPVPRRVQRGAGPLLHRQLARFRRGAQELGLRTGDVDHRVQADRLGDDAAPAGVEGAHDVGVRFGGRRRREQKRVLEPQPGERNADRSHGAVLGKTACLSVTIIGRYSGTSVRRQGVEPLRPTYRFNEDGSVCTAIARRRSPLVDMAEPVAGPTTNDRRPDSCRWRSCCHERC